MKTTIILVSLNRPILAETWPASHQARAACDRIKKNTAVVEFVQSLDVQLAEAFSLAHVSLTCLW